MIENLLHTLISFDHQLFLLINRDIANPVFDAVFPVITNGRFWIIPGIAAAGIFIIKHRLNALIAISLALITISLTDPICDNILKPIFHRFRPCHPHYFVEGGRFLLGLKSSLSFPSAHAMNMFAQATLFTLLYPRRWIWFFSFACLIGFSRVYTGVHYPLDVAGGAVFGAFIAGFVYVIYKVIRRYFENKVLHTRQKTDSPLPPAA
jgi:undecaprenyl-diphosphatase